MRVHAFSDSQNLYRLPKSVFPDAGDDYDPKFLATLITKRQSSHLVQTRFFLAISDQNRYQIGEKIWNFQLFLMNRDECKTTTRISLDDNSDHAPKFE